LHDVERGWGRAGETWRTLEAAVSWGGEDWFMLGDLDIGLHLVRTQALRAGEPLSAVTARLAEAARVATRLLPATDDVLRTSVVTPAGTLAFQEWFVARRHEDEVDAISVAGAESASPAPGVIEAIDGAEALVFAPSNPYVSLGPILAVAAIREAVERRRVRCVAVSPLVGGRAVKGPLDRMLSRMAVAGCYVGLIDALVVDRSDTPAEAGVPLIATSTLMLDRADAYRLAETVLEVAA
jgi:LPPG:FO 2-phospho-L-lactate transferase